MAAHLQDARDHLGDLLLYMGNLNAAAADVIARFRDVDFRAATLTRFSTYAPPPVALPESVIAHSRRLIAKRADVAAALAAAGGLSPSTFSAARIDRDAVVDASRSAAYLGHGMNWLLLLSALLSALTGAGGTARAPQAAVAVAQVVTTDTSDLATPATIARPVATTASVPRRTLAPVKPQPFVPQLTPRGERRHE